MLLKLFASAFFGTALQPMLTAAGCDTLIVTGASTSGCVRATVVDAVQHGLCVHGSRARRWPTARRRTRGFAR